MHYPTISVAFDKSIKALMTRAPSCFTGLLARHAPTVEAIESIQALFSSLWCREVYEGIVVVSLVLEVRWHINEVNIFRDTLCPKYVHELGTREIVGQVRKH